MFYSSGHLTVIIPKVPRAVVLGLFDKKYCMWLLVQVTMKEVVCHTFPTWVQTMGSLCMASVSCICSGWKPFDSYVHLRASVWEELWQHMASSAQHASAPWYVRRQEQFNSIIKYPKRTTGLSSLVSSSVMMWLCVFLIRAQAFLGHKEKKKRKGVGPFNSMHTGLISFRAHYRVERGFSLSRKMQVMRHLKYSTTLG